MMHPIKMGLNEKRKHTMSQQIAEEKIARCKAEKIPYLSLGDLQLDTIPESISELTWIGALTLSRNNITNIEVLAPLINIHKLAFAHNNIENIDVIRNFPKLKFLFS